MSVEILALPDTETDAACALFSTVYGHPIEPAQWRWKYRLGPRLGSLNMAARAADGRWVGHVGAIVFPGTCQGRPLPMAQVCDIMVERGARGGLSRDGVYPRLIAALRDALGMRFPGVYAYGFPGERPFRLGERIGYYRRLYTCREVRVTAEAAPTASGWAARALDWHAPDSIEAAARALDRDWKRLGRRQATPRVARTGAWMTWRYANHPTHAYRLWRLRHWWRPAGWLVTRQMPDGHQWIVDALLPDVRSAAGACAALRAALARESSDPPSLAAWLDLRGSEATPIVATEFLVRHWHTELPSPAFQPGDTDVY